MPATDPFNVVFLGAGNIMFGSDEGPWNHSARFEKKLGDRFRMLAVVDPNLPRVHQTIATKRADPAVRHAYLNTEVYGTLDDLIAAYKGKEDTIRVFVIGLPPAFRGGVTTGTDFELRVSKAFPNAHLFIEKPVSTSSLEDAFKVGEILSKNIPRIVSVGYMMRYLRAVSHVKKIVDEQKLTVMATNARYACAYPSCMKPDWWDKSLSCGPIVEQATHFCDLSRFFGGLVDLESVQARALEWNEPAGKLTKIHPGVKEETIPPENRIPRATTAIWKYKTGAVGHLTHIVALQGTSYSCELEIFADGYMFIIEDPYNTPRLRIRSPLSDEEEVIVFKDDDPFLEEVSVFIDAIENKDNYIVRSPFIDACETYALTRAIRIASERK
ncbi:hypothetical protein AURDEDRAFT_116074 [Auricularia subglabra TFB-10046 SS5]|nr:hypothetical protein AURDEDRAFT_116074 [Auricularia subglabra TFB-10046 SS5]